MDIVQLLRQSAENGRGRQLTAEQIEYLLGTMGRMAYDRHRAIQWAESAEFSLSAYINKYGEMTQEEIEELGEIPEDIVEGEVVSDDEETTEVGQPSEGMGLDASVEEQEPTAIPETAGGDEQE